MTKSTADRQRAYREAQAASGMVRVYVWLTPAQRQKLRDLGSDAWLRRKIDSAKSPQ